MKQVKLVVWDLDETYWQGTLSEGLIHYSVKNHAVVVELSRRGIVNSVCSKNTFHEARACLEQNGIWDYFVFPKIDWKPKGQMISEIIQQMQLRPENVLFIDDNHLNLEEARFFCPGIQTAGPGSIHELLTRDSCKGKNDARLSRLKQYKHLEQKSVDQKVAAGSNEDFLRSCAIAAKVGHDCAAHRDRILELINRTNQLNYTKHRLTGADLDALLADSSREKGYVEVSDRYGDYGLCGFYAKSARGLEHFLFSCRILNMGVENWLFRRLGSPALDIAGEVVTPLNPGMKIDWIREAGAGLQPEQEEKFSANKHGISIMVKGGCDLLQIKNYLVRGTRFEAEVNYVSAKGLMVENSHTELLRQAGSQTLGPYGDVIDKLPFFDRDAVTTKFFAEQHDVYIYGVLDDYSRGLYRYKNTDFIIPFDDIDLDATQRQNWHVHVQRTEKNRLDEAFLAWFSDNFEFLGAIDPDSFTRNINWLCDRISKEKLLIILNGSEVAYHPCPENNRWERHKKMNAALETAVRGRHNVVVCDIREFLTTPEDHRHNIRHYSRKVYFQIAQKINAIIEQRYNISLGFWQKQGHFFKVSKKRVRKYIKKNIRQALRKVTPLTAIMLCSGFCFAAARNVLLIFTGILS